METHKARVKVESVGVRCLLETGAQVLTITESFSANIVIKEGLIRGVSQLVKISATQGLEIPYVGNIYRTTPGIHGTCTISSACGS